MLESMKDLAVTIEDPGVGDASNFLAQTWPLLAGAAVLAYLFMYFKDMTVKKIVGAGLVIVVLIIIIPQLFSRTT